MLGQAGEAGVVKPLVDGHPAPGECWDELAEHSLTHDDLPKAVAFDSAARVPEAAL